MIGYSLLDEEEIIPKKPIYKNPPKKQKTITENTECNYLVMFFVTGVFLLVISDQIK